MKKKMPALKTGYFSLDVLYGYLELQNDNNNNKTQTEMSERTAHKIFAQDSRWLILNIL